ncbi:hypothetical protein BgiBS90_013244 [Biomphalaria glabrata]|nr:hypothetical protein BgiBS90_013244 [Biomphalaria glabrata]
MLYNKVHKIRPYQFLVSGGNGAAGAIQIIVEELLPLSTKKEDCPEKTFGYDCNRICYHCREDCDRLTVDCVERVSQTEVTPVTHNVLHSPGVTCVWKTVQSNVKLIVSTELLESVRVYYTMLFVLLTWPLTIIPVTCISYLIVWYLLYIVCSFHRSLVVELEEEYDEILLQ